MGSNRFVACGMYAFNDDLRRSWRQLLDRFFALLHPGESAPEIVFDSDRSVLLEKNLLFGHTCGYPLMTHLRGELLPFCVPCFDLPGCDGGRYSSRLVVAADSAVETLSDCRGAIVAINSADSNSGMNLLRHALATAGARPPFFREVLMTGGHGSSLAAVAGGRAQLAAIDCVSYRLIEDQDPRLAKATRSLGFSARTCGLPLVVPAARAATAPLDEWTATLGRALEALPAVRQTLHLEGFTRVDEQDYRSILELETAAIDRGYPQVI